MHRKNEVKLKNCAHRNRAEEPTAPNKTYGYLKEQTE